MLKRLTNKPGETADKGGLWTFLGQSGWLVIATAVSGICMLLVHPAAATMPLAEYGVFFTLLRSMSLVSVPANALEATFSWKTARSREEAHLAEIAGAARWTFKGSLILFGTLAVLLVPLAGRISSALHLQNTTGLWVTLLVMLVAVWLGPVRGMLQGAERFSSLGTLTILGSFGRLLFVCLAVVILFHHATGGMVAVLTGLCLALAFGLWKTRDIWRRADGEGSLRGWISHAIPLTVAPTAVLLLSTCDTFFVQLTFTPEDTAFYMAPQLVGMVMLQFTSPIAAVLFVRATRSAAGGSLDSPLRWAILTTAATSGLLALVANLLPSTFLSVLYFTKPQFSAMQFLIPWCTLTTFLITILNVIVSQLLAVKSYRIVQCLVAVIGLYFITLFLTQDHIQSLNRDEGFLLIAQIAAFHALLALLSGSILLKASFTGNQP